MQLEEITTYLQFKNSFNYFVKRCVDRLRVLYYLIKEKQNNNTYFDSFVCTNFRLSYLHFYVFYLMIE